MNMKRTDMNTFKLILENPIKAKANLVKSNFQKATFNNLYLLQKKYAKHITCEKSIVESCLIEMYNDKSLNQ